MDQILPVRELRIAAFCFLTLSCASVSFAGDAFEPDLTVVLDFHGAHSDHSIQEMQIEASRIMGEAGVRVNWRALQDVGSESFKDVVVMSFKGACKPAPLQIVYDERGPYAFTEETDGEIQPFGVVYCTRVAASVRSEIAAINPYQPELLLGRALGRVVAHELVHMLTKSEHHAKTGAGQAALSPRQLVTESLPLSAFDIERLREGRRAR